MMLAAAAREKIHFATIHLVDGILSTISNPRQMTPSTEPAKSVMQSEEITALLQAIDTPLSPLSALIGVDEQLWFSNVAVDFPITSGPVKLDHEVASRHDARMRESDAIATCSGVIVDDKTGRRALTQTDRVAKKQIEYRNKKKAELVELRAALESLTERRDGLMSKRTKTTRELRTLSAKFGLVPGWKGISMRQMQRRLDAEALNRDLRYQVHLRQVLIENLSTTLRSQPSSSDPMRANEFLRRGSRQHCAPTVNDKDMRLVESLMSEMEGLYRQTREIFSELGAAHAWESSKTAWYECKWRRLPTTEYVAFMNTKVFPFELRDVIWATMTAMGEVFGTSCTRVDVPMSDAANTLAIKFHFEYRNISQPRLKSNQYGCISVIKVFPEADRSIVVWRAIFTECHSRAQYVETGWCIAYHNGAAGSPGTGLHICCRICPIRVSSSPTNADFGANLNEFAEMMALVAENDALKLTTAMEDILLGSCKQACHPDDGRMAQKRVSNRKHDF